MGLPEDMTVRLLKEVLDDLNITYGSSEKKADLIENVCCVTPFPLLSSGILELCLKTAKKKLI